MVEHQREPAPWSQLVEALSGLLTERGTLIEFACDNLEVQLGQGAGPDASQARWTIN